MKAALKITSDDHDDLIDLAVEGASRQIDDYCGRRFWQDGTVVARTYHPTTARMAFVDDISTTTGLIVKVDEDDDGTFEKTLTINTDFQVLPTNAAAEYPVQPYTSIGLLDGDVTSYAHLGSGRPYLQVTAKFGWPAVPESVERACVFQSKNLFRAPDQNFGTFQLSVDGSPLRIPPLDPVARALLEGYRRWSDRDLMQ